MPTSATTQNAHEELHFLEVWRVLWNGRYTILSVLAFVVGIAFLRVSFAKPIYEAQATIEIKPEGRRILPGQEQGLGAEGGGWLSEEKYFATQMEVIGSRDVAERAFRQLRLEKSPAFAKATDAVAAFQGLVKVHPKVNTRLVIVTMRGGDPAETRDWVNAVVDVYVKRNVDVATASFHAITDEIEKGLSRFRGDLGQADLLRMRSAADQELFIPENQQDMLRQRLQAYSDGLTKVNVDIASLGAEISSLEKIRAAKGDVLVIPRFGQDPDLQFLNTQRMGLEREMERLSAEKKARHPDILSKALELQKVQERIDDQIAAIEGKLRSQYEIAQSNASYLTERIRGTEENAYQVKRKSSEYEIQKTDSEAKRKVYDIVAETVQRLTIGAQLIAMNNNIVVLDRAIAPRWPVAPRPVLSMAVGALLGLLAGIGLVLFMDYLDNTIRSPEDIEQYLGLSMLGILPKFKEADSASAREAFQSLRTSVLFSSHNRERRVLVLTSSGPQEGKSSTIAFLARTLAGSGDRVVVVDCDLRRPTQHVHHGLNREPGATNLLVDRNAGAYAQYLQSTGIPTLKIMTCGPIPPNPPDLIGSPQFRNLLADLRRDFDWVLVDSPPVAGLADAIVLATLADMVAFVIKHNHNDRQLIRRCLKQLRDVNAQVIGAILNGVDLGKAYHKNYYYAGYHYASEAEQPAGRKRRARSGGDQKVAL